MGADKLASSSWLVLAICEQDVFSIITCWHTDIQQIKSNEGGNHTHLIAQVAPFILSQCLVQGIEQVSSRHAESVPHPLACSVYVTGLHVVADWEVLSGSNLSASWAQYSEEHLLV